MAAFAAVAAQAVYPVAAQLLIAPDLENACAPESESCQVAGGSIIATALRAEVSRLFRTPTAGEAPELVLEARLVRAVADKWQSFPDLTLVVAIDLRDAKGRVDAVRVTGADLVLSHDAGGLHDAVERAARDLQRKLRGELESSEPFVRWLIARGFTPRTSSILGPARGRLLAFGDLGAGVALAGSPGPALEARFGLEAPWLFTQAIVEFQRTSPDVGSVSASGIGFELGPALRLGRNWEIRAGAGLHHVSGSLDATPIVKGSNDYSRNLASVVAALQYARVFDLKNSLRWRAGIQFRKYFDTGQPFEPEFTVVDVASYSMMVTFGLEFSLIGSGESAIAP